MRHHSYDGLTRRPGRAFDDHEKPLGYDLLEWSTTSSAVHEDFRGRAAQAGSQRNGVAERAKGIAVLRKLDELVFEDNLPVEARNDIQRALELSCGRVGVTFPEYRALMDRDPELLELEAKVLEDAKKRRAQGIES
jgi:hypothetical protein